MTIGLRSRGNGSARLLAVTTRMSRRAEMVVFVALTFAIAWPLLRWSVRGGDFELLAGIAMCAPGAVGLVLAWTLRREGPGAARVGVGSVLAWPVAFLAPPLVIGAVGLLAQRFGAFELHRDFHLALPYVGQASGARVLWKLGLFVLILHGSYVLPAVAEDLTARRGLRSRGLIRLVAWSVPMAVAHIAGDFGEELGWRGFLLRRWEDRPRAGVALSSVVWSLFHLLWAIELARTRGVASASLFLAAIALLGVPMAALYRWGRSVWPCAVAHGGLDAWGAILLGSALDPSFPSYGSVEGGWSNPYGVAVFAALAAATWRRATRPAAGMGRREAAGSG